MWQRLYFLNRNNGETIRDILREAVKSAGYTIYDPFGLMPGLSYPQTVKMFISPRRVKNLHCVIASPDPIDDAIVQAVSGFCVRLNADGTATFPREANQLLVALLPDDDRAIHALIGIIENDPLTIERYAPPIDTSQDAATPQIAAIPLDSLPPDVQSAIASGKGVSAEAAEKLFSKMSGSILGKLDPQTAAQAGAAQALLNANKIDWNTAGGRQIRALLAFLGLPSPFEAPDFNTLREAYQLHARKRRNPNATDYPGDAEAMAAVPNALDYLPVYGGKR